MPNKTEILEHIDHAYELANEAGTARWRLYDLLKNGEFSEADRLEALVLVKGTDPDALTLAIAAIRRDVDGDSDDSTPPAVDGLPTDDDDEYAGVFDGSAPASQYLDAAHRLFDAAKVLGFMSNIAGTPFDEDGGASQKFLAQSAYRVADLVELAQAFESAGRAHAE